MKTACGRNSPRSQRPGSALPSFAAVATGSAAGSASNPPNWAKHEIRTVVAHGLMGASSVKTFKPNAPLTVQTLSDLASGLQQQVAPPPASRATFRSRGRRHDDDDNDDDDHDDTTGTTTPAGTARAARRWRPSTASSSSLARASSAGKAVLQSRDRRGAQSAEAVRDGGRRAASRPPPQSSRLAGLPRAAPAGHGDARRGGVLRSADPRLRRRSPTAGRSTRSSSSRPRSRSRQ